MGEGSPGAATLVSSASCEDYLSALKRHIGMRVTQGIGNVVPNKMHRQASSKSRLNCFMCVACLVTLFVTTAYVRTYPF